MIGISTRNSLGTAGLQEPSPLRVEYRRPWKGSCPQLDLDRREDGKGGCGCGGRGDGTVYGQHGGYGHGGGGRRDATTSGRRRADGGTAPVGGCDGNTRI